MSHSSENLLINKIKTLEEENQYLRRLLQKHRIPFAQTLEAPSPTHKQRTYPQVEYSTKEKIAIFRKLFRGRTDVYPVRWSSQNGKSGYSPACANEWRPGICGKPRIGCADCNNRSLLPVTDEVIYNHLSGKITIGVYALLPDDRCWFLAVDFDKAEWREDATGFLRSCAELALPAHLEASHSGKGAHVWLFFSQAVPATDARRLGSAIISHTCARNRQLELSSYDRLFPNQDRMPKGGFGNLIALPLQKEPRARGCSVFVDDQLNPIDDQWDYLATIKRITPKQIETAITEAVGTSHPLDIAFILEEDEREPWRQSPTKLPTIEGSLPDQLDIVLADRVYFDKAALPRQLQNRLVRIAAFQNPTFYQNQALRLSVWNTPRIIGCADNLAHHVALPRGCLDDVLTLLNTNKVRYQIDDKRFDGEEIQVEFTGTLRPDQDKAVKAMLKQNTGVLCAPPAFGKTVTAAAIIAKRSINTLILVHRKELMLQWRERLNTFLELGTVKIGNRGGGRRKLHGKIDIALMQSLSRNLEDNIIEQYGQVIVDECHHISATSFESLLKQSKARFILGLTATPIRRDGWHPIIFMQCGPIRHRAKNAINAPDQLLVIPHLIETLPANESSDSIQHLFSSLTENPARNQLIANDIMSAYRNGHKILVLSERVSHLSVLEQLLKNNIPELHVLHGKTPKKERTAIMTRLEELPPDSPRVLIASGKLVGEGFDHPPLDTLFLTMPLSWKGTLQQYAGRLHRNHVDKEIVQIHDYIDSGYLQLERMWQKRRTGYSAMGYQIIQQKALLI
jgi:superfamily II DNA or RNA helicase